VVVTAERARLLDIQNIDRALNDADGSLVARRVGANAARRFSAKPPHCAHSMILSREVTNTLAKRLATALSA